MYEVAADPDSSFEEKLDALFDLGCERFGLDLGGIAKVDPDADRFEIEHVSDDHDHFEPGLELPLSETYCTAATATGGVASVADPVEAGYDDIYVHDEFGITMYLGTYIEVEDDLDRTFFFVAEDSHHGPFTNAERTFQQLLGQWVQYELERRQRERELERTLDLLEKTERIADVGGWEIDVDTQDVFWTDHIFELLDVDADEEPPLEEALDMYHEDDKPIVTDAVETALASGESFNVEVRIRTGTDDVRWLRLQGVPETADGEVVSLRGAAQDVTERKERERELDETVTELRESEERLQLALEAGEMGTWDLDLQTGDAPVRSPQHDRIFGYEEPLDDWDFETFLDHVDPDDRDRVKQRFEDAFETGKWEFECWITGADGERRAIAAQGEFHHDSSGEPVRAVGIAQDITEHKEHAERLEQKNDRLESFASMLAHELRNPTMIGQIYSQQLPDDDAEAVEYVTEAFDRIEDIIDIMLVLTRGREAVGERTPVALADAARDAWGDMDAPDAALDVELDDMIEADETYIQHLFRNLLENAVDHGGSDVTVEVGSLEDGFYVADDGPGIPPEDRDAIFDEGYTTAADNGGTGLGLAFVQKLAAVYEWDCTVTESASGGARFEFETVSEDCS